MVCFKIVMVIVITVVSVSALFLLIKQMYYTTLDQCILFIRVGVVFLNLNYFFSLIVCQFNMMAIGQISRTMLYYAWNPRIFYLTVCLSYPTVDWSAFSLLYLIVVCLWLACSTLRVITLLMTLITCFSAATESGLAHQRDRPCGFEDGAKMFNNSRYVLMLLYIVFIIMLCIYNKKIICNH